MSKKKNSRASENHEFSHWDILIYPNLLFRSHCLVFVPPFLSSLVLNLLPCLYTYTLDKVYIDSFGNMEVALKIKSRT